MYELTARLKRFLIAIILLGGLFAAYRMGITPALQPTMRNVASQTTYETQPPRPLENVRIAQTYFAQEPWVSQARYHLRSQQAFLFTNDVQPEGHEGRLRLTPFALAWIHVDQQTQREQAWTLLSESALVKFEANYDFAHPDPGRIIFAALDGTAQLTGPDGLLLQGRNFFFSEASANLWSDHAVKFAYAHNYGSAGGMELDLIPHPTSPRNDLPHIFGVHRLRLRGNVNLQLDVEQSQQPLTLYVRSGGFEYDLLSHQAVFHTDVQVSRRSTPQELEWIDCQRLTLWFKTQRPTPSQGNPRPETMDFQHLDSRLEFVRLQAERNTHPSGNRAHKPVTIVSQTRNLVVTTDYVSYDATQQKLDLRAEKGVRIRHHGLTSQVEAPAISLTFTASRQLASLLCSGPGWFVHRAGEDAHSDILAAAEWQHSLRYEREVKPHLDVWELRESASLRLPQEQTALGADLVQLWCSPLDWSETAGLEATAPLKDDTRQFPLEQLRPQRMVAQGQVVVVHPRIECLTQELVCVVTDISPEKDTTSAVTPAVHMFSKGKSSSTSSPTSESILHVAADTLQFQCAQRPSSRDLIVQELLTQGNVVITQSSKAQKQPQMVMGSKVQIRGLHTPRHQKMLIAGEPARIQDERFSFETMAPLEIDRDRELIVSSGPGSMRLMLQHDFQGQSLETAQPLEIRWQERVQLVGQRAVFSGQVLASLATSRLECHQLQVTLSQTWVSQLSEESQQPPEVVSVWCEDRVRLQSSVNSEQQVTEIYRAQLADLKLDRVSGNWQASGPGLLQMWRRGQNPRAGLGAPRHVVANRPSGLDPGNWEYTAVQFQERMLGNMHRRYAHFFSRVEITHGPVKDSLDTIYPDRLPPRSGWMRCDELQVMQQLADDGASSALQVVGLGNVDLEGHEFYARADQIIYDESKGAYTIRGLGRPARLWHLDASGRTHPAEFQGMVYRPETRELRALVIAGEGGK